MTTQLNILFMAFPSRVSDTGELPVYCRLTYRQRQKRFMIGCRIPLERWNQPKQRAIGKSSQAQTVNQHIDTIRQKVHNAEAELLRRAEAFEVEDIVNLVQGGSKAACRTLMQLYHYRLKQMKKLEGIDFKASTLRKFVQASNSVKLFLKYQYNAEDISISHTLRITKTQEAYNRKMKDRNEDLELLNKMDITG